MRSLRIDSSWRRRWLAVAAVAWAAVAGRAEEPVAGAGRCVIVAVYAPAEPTDDASVRAVEAFAASRRGVVVVRRFIDVDPEARAALAALATRHGFDPAATPVVEACGRVIHGVRDADAVGRRLREAITVEVFVRPGCGRCQAAKDWLPALHARHPGLELALLDLAADAGARTLLADLVRRHKTAAASVPVFHLCDRLVVGFDRPETSGRRIEAVIDPWSRPCPEKIGEPTSDATEPFPGEDCIDVPLFGRVDPTALGMPLFTLAIGLVDGFNPCAMWVLLLLLSILVNVRDRWRMLAIAGTFVAVSGAAYFAFMAAWLNVFEWIGYLRPVQVALGLLAVGIGCVHVKDFFAFHRGVSLSIPEAAKPGIYARIRGIVTAENLTAAIVGAFTLAVLVNVVELLCTAGLPALYTSVLARQGYSSVGRYGYLGLYIAAYMFDDALMVAGVVATMSRMRLEETGGRWLKLVSGLVILALGLVMLLRPEWLG
jgi:uncharacterized membrane protein HdeD (DUF308 family)/glutaredoxin